MKSRISRRTLLAGAAGFLLAGCARSNEGEAPPAATSAAARYPVPDLLVDASWLAERIDDPRLRLIDCSSLPAYRDGHLPGARHLWWQDTIEINNPVYGMLTGSPVRARILRDAGIGSGTTVVAYDRDGGVYAARLIWMLQFDSFSGGRMLDGGAQAWTQQGGSLTLKSPSTPDGGIQQMTNEGILAHAHDIAARLGDPGLILLDTRTAAERGDTWNGKLRSGAIPGSRHLPRDRFLTPGPVPVLVAPDELRARLAEAGAPADLATSEFVVYGLHGTLAALPWLALTALGAGNVRLYDGSWSEWGADPDLPVEPFSG